MQYVYLAAWVPEDGHAMPHGAEDEGVVEVLRVGQVLPGGLL
jgi:hypothetical protein